MLLLLLLLPTSLLLLLLLLLMPTKTPRALALLRPTFFSFPLSFSYCFIVLLFHSFMPPWTDVIWDGDGDGDAWGNDVRSMYRRKGGTRK